MDGQLPFMRVPHDTMREGLPGAKAGVTHLASSNFGAEILSNDVDRFGFESYLDNPADRSDAPRRDLHAAMELKLGMDKTPGYGPGAKR